MPWGAIADIAGAIIGANSANSQAEAAQAFAEKQFKWQKKITRKAVQIRARDARAAGIHPLAALGFSGHSYSPVNYPQSNAGEILSQGISSAGHALGGALNQKQQAKVAAELAASEISVNTAQADLLKAQQITLLQNASAQTRGATTGVEMTQPSSVPNVGTPNNQAATKIEEAFKPVMIDGEQYSVANQDVVPEIEDAAGWYLFRKYEHYRKNPNALYNDLTEFIAQMSKSERERLRHEYKKQVVRGIRGPLPHFRTPNPHRR